MVAAGWPAYAWSFPIDGPGHASRANVGFGMLRSTLAEHDFGQSRRQALEGPLAQLLPGQPADPDSLRAHLLRSRHSAHASRTDGCSSSATLRH